MKTRSLIRGEERRKVEKVAPNQALALVPWKHDWALFLSNVIIVGAFWWSFFVFNLAPAVDVLTPKTPKPVLDDPVLAKEKKPPDKLPFLTQDFETVCHLISSQERQFVRRLPLLGQHRVIQHWLWSLGCKDINCRR